MGGQTRKNKNIMLDKKLVKISPHNYFWARRTVFVSIGHSYHNFHVSEGSPVSHLHLGSLAPPEPRTRDLGTGWVHRDVYKAIYTSRFEELCDNQGTKIYLLVQENRLGGDTHAYSEGIMSQFDDILKFLGFFNKTSHFLDFGLIKKIIAYIQSIYGLDI